MEGFGDCRTVDHGEDALRVFFEAHREGDPFDLIMLDINLPGMDGIQLLSAIRNAERELNIKKSSTAKILMTSSYRDKDRIVASVQSGCDDYIGKPFNLDLIRDKLKKLGLKVPPPLGGTENNCKPTIKTTSQIYSEIVSLINQNQTKLPSLPKLYLQFRKLMARRASFKEIVGLLRKDIAIAAEIIRRSNSAYYRGFAANKSLEQAVARMGYDAIVQVVTELSIRKFFSLRTKKYRALIENLWKHSISCAYTAEITSKLAVLDLNSDPFLMGLLHDIGKLVILQMIADMERMGKFNDGIHPIMLVNILEDYHCRLGAKLLEKWKFADCYIHISLNHHRQDPLAPADAKSDKGRLYLNELMVVQYASQMANLMGYDIIDSGPAEIDLQEIAANQQLGLNPERIAETITQVTDRMKSVQELF